MGSFLVLHLEGVPNLVPSLDHVHGSHGVLLHYFCLLHLEYVIISEDSLSEYVARVEEALGLVRAFPV